MQGCQNRIAFALVLAVCLMGWPFAATAQNVGGCYIGTNGDYVCDNYVPPQRPARGPDKLLTRPSPPAFTSPAALMSFQQLQDISNSYRQRLADAQAAAAAQFFCGGGGGGVVPTCAPKGNTIQVSGASAGALQQAINSAKPGDTVVLPAGTIKNNKPITIKNGVSLQGAGRDRTVLEWTGGKMGHRTGMINYSCSGGQQVSVSDIRFQGYGGSRRGPPHSGRVQSVVLNP